LIDFEQLRLAFAHVLKKRRCGKNLSQVDLAAASGVADSYISRLEKGDRMPSLDVVFRVSKALGISPETLVKEIRKQWIAEKP
jgi:transcriptional regulator with XRE-family HTH domain